MEMTNFRNHTNRLHLNLETDTTLFIVHTYCDYKATKAVSCVCASRWVMTRHSKLAAITTHMHQSHHLSLSDEHISYNILTGKQITVHAH